MKSNLGLLPAGAAAVCIKPWIRPGTKRRAEIEDLLKPEVQGDWNRVQYPEGRVQLHLDSSEGQGLRRPSNEHPDGEQDPDEAGIRTLHLAAVYRFKGQNTVYWIYSSSLARTIH